MGKALKPLIVILFLCSVAALVLGVLLFNQREILKGRTQNLEKAAKQFANSIRFDDFEVADVMDYETMNGPLDKLAAAGGVMYADLQDTKQLLENTRQELAQTKATLEDTRLQLAQTEATLEATRNDLSQRTAELAQANDRISDLEQQTESLQAEVEGLNTKVAETEEFLSECEAEYASLKKDYEDLLGETTDMAGQTRGLSGMVLLVNSTWNFVVLNIGSEAGLVPSSELLVHRSDRLVGKVRISTVEDRISVAEIVNDWEQHIIQRGDHVISPES